MMSTSRLALLCALFVAACDTSSGAPSDSKETSTPAESARSSHTPLGSVPVPMLGTAPPTPVPPLPPSEFGRMVRDLSEPDGSFFSDNIISNETSYLQVAQALEERAAQGGAYIGVGPEQNFSYIALCRPKLAFIIDIRRQNMILHLLYRAAFEEATSRAHFVSLLFGRRYEAAGDPGEGASIEAVLAHAEKNAPDEAELTKTHARLRERIEREVRLDAEDKKTLELLHRTFFKGQLEIRFELHQPSGRRYPTLRELFAEKDPGGVARGFLASEEAFRFVQGMEREGRVIPVVGDFAGDRAMPGIAAELTKAGLNVSAFYVSNVEQYLFEPKVWAKWSRNVRALPVSEQSLFIRAYLDQGRRHPQQMKGHRTATLLQRMGDFTAREASKPYASFWSLVTDRAAGEEGRGVD